MNIQKYLENNLKNYEGDAPLESKIMEFFKNNPYPEDSMVHKFAEENKIDPHKLETKIYELISTFLSGGLFNEKKPRMDTIDKKELEMGVEVEYEHVDKKSPFAKEMAKRIALDHLTEIEDYYTRLDKMEKESEIKR